MDKDEKSAKMKKSDLIKENIKLNQDIDMYQRWCKEYKEYSDRMIKASYDGEMPISVSPISNIQYIEYYSAKAVDIIKKSIHDRKVYKFLSFIEGVVIFLLAMIIVSM